MSLLKNAAAMVLAIVSFALTMGLVIGIQRLTDVNLFSLMLWGIIPAGAFLMGFLAASGYYFGAVKLDLKPTKKIAVGMLIVAALVQFSLYYWQYTMATTEDGQAISHFLSFPRYTAWALTNAKYGLVVYGYRPGGADGGLQVGGFGYLIALLQFLALAVGGLGVYAILVDKPYCDSCKKFLEPVGRKIQFPYDGDVARLAKFRTSETQIGGYLERLRDLPPGSEAAIELSLLRCARCGREALTERTLSVKKGKLAYNLEGPRISWNSGKSIEPLLLSLIKAFQ